MNLSALLVAALWLFPPVPQAGPYTASLNPRESFRTAAESTLDDASAVNIKGDDSEFTPQMQNLKAANLNLTRMADVDSERTIAAAVNDLVFAITACHIVAKGGAATTQCETEINDARTHAMQVLGARKTNGTWQDAPPA